MVSDGSRGVADRVVGVDHRGAFGKIRLKGSLEHVARVHDDHATVMAACATQIRHESCQDGKPVDAAVQVAGADDRKDDRFGGRIRRTGPDGWGGL